MGVAGIAVWIPKVLESVAPVEVEGVTPVVVTAARISPVIPLVFPEDVSGMFAISPTFDSTEKINPIAPSWAGWIVFPTGRVDEGRHTPGTKFVGFYPDPPGGYFAAVVTGATPDAPVRRKDIKKEFGTDEDPIAATLGSLVMVNLYVGFSWECSSGATTTIMAAAEVRTFS